MNEQSSDGANTLLSNLAQGITSEWGVTIICLAILIWAFAAFFIFRKRIAPMVTEVDAALTNILPLDGEEGFASGFDAFDEKIRLNPVLKHAWSEFDETLIKDPILLPVAIRNTRGASEYFSRANVIGDRLNLRFYSALPNLLTGTGILGTFVGLVAGIWMASQGLASPDTAEVMGALQNLLHGASLAFSTSIVGLFTSILFSWREKYWVHTLDGKLRRWNDELESRLRRVTGESLITEQLAQGKQQTEILTQFTTDLAFQIADAFQEKMSASMGPAMDRLLAAVEGLREDQGRRNDDALMGMVAKFSESLSGAAGQELTALGTTLQTLNEKLESQIDTLGTRQREMDEASTKSMNDLAKVIKWSMSQMQTGVGEALQQIIDRVGEMVGELAGDMRSAAQEAAERLTELSKSFDESLDEALKVLQGGRDLSDEYQILLSETNEVITKMSEAGQMISALVEPIGQAADGFRDSAGILDGASQKNQEAVQQLVQTVQTLSELQDQINDTWDTYSARFEAVDDSLGKVFQELVTGLDSYTERVKEFVDGLDKHTGSIVSDLAGANAELTNAVEELAETMGRQQ